VYTLVLEKKNRWWWN